MHLLFLFLDGVGLGANDPTINPFAQAKMPHLEYLLGNRLTMAALHNGGLQSERATLTALDACLGVEGLPQSATGQAVLLTGINVPAQIGYHYGPKPNPAVAEFLVKGTLFSELNDNQQSCTFLNAYPPAYFQAIESGRRLYSAIPQAVVNAGLNLKNTEDLQRGEALAADFTGQGWRAHLHIPSTPLLSPYKAGERLATLAQQYRFSMFEYWLSDYAGHQQDMGQAVQLLESLDQVLGGLISTWDDQKGLILITSDHGNLEDLSTRRHTANPVPAITIGAPELRAQFCANLHDLTGIAKQIRSFLQSDA